MMSTLTTRKRHCGQPKAEWKKDENGRTEDTVTRSPKSALREAAYGTASVSLTSTLITSGEPKRAEENVAEAGLATA